MATCPNCRASITTTQAFCQSCGLPLTRHAWETAPPAGMRPAMAPVAGTVATAAMPSRNDGGAIASMVLGIIGLVAIPLIASIIALGLGYGARRRIRESRHLDGDGFATAGIVTGWLGLILPIVGILVAFSLMGDPV